MAKASAYLPSSVADGLDPSGFRLYTMTNGLKSTVCELWWAKTVSSSQAPKNGNLHYGSLQVGAFVGVLHFPAEASEDYREDFHDQKLRPGYYTMRYAPQPKDPDQKSSPEADFLVLSPVSVDRDPSRVLDMGELVRLSKIATRTGSPAVVSLADGSSGGGAQRVQLPSVSTNDSGLCILRSEVRVAGEKGGSRNMPVAVVLVTPKQDNGAS
jgi:hypothetical protein